MRAKRLIINADDLGLTEGHNRAILDAHWRGIVTSASLLACGVAFDDAVASLRTAPTLGIGVHLSLLEGVPVLPFAQVPDLVDTQGRFGLSYAALFGRLALRRGAIEQVTREWRAQIERVLGAGIRVTHLDSHKHVHMHPRLLGVALALAGEYGLWRMRLSRPLCPTCGAKTAVLSTLGAWGGRRAEAYGVRTPHALLGLEASGRMTTPRVLAALSRLDACPPGGVCELMMHPAHAGPTLDRLREEGYRWIGRFQFEQEHRALCAPVVRTALDQLGIERVSYEAV
jgi:hopanoid biosynthesis associated protein HpnK